MNDRFRRNDLAQRTSAMSAVTAASRTDWVRDPVSQKRANVILSDLLVALSGLFQGQLHRFPFGAFFVVE
jgi:hypothetical protein